MAIIRYSAMNISAQTINDQQQRQLRQLCYYLYWLQ